MYHVLGFFIRSGYAEWRGPGVDGFLAVRDHYIDDALQNFLKEGMQQLANLGAVYCTDYALPYLKQTRGRIVAVSNLGGKTAILYNTPYCSSKYAMHGFFDTLRMELYQSGVSCTEVCPSQVVTALHESQHNKRVRRAGRVVALTTTKER